MKKRGFTLIELLAVIVILALIALIAVPIIMNIIEESRKGAAERGAENYMHAVETAVVKELKYGNELKGEYTIQLDASLCEGKDAIGCENPIKINMSGNKPTSGTVVIENGIVTTNSTFGIGDYTVSYNPEQKMYIATKAGEDSEEGAGGNTSTIVYRYSSEEIRIGDTIDPNDTTKVVTNPTTLGQKQYLKHVLDKDNKVTETWGCVVFSGEEICLKGGAEDDEANYRDNVLILQNLRDKNIEGLTCSIGEVSSICTLGSASLQVDLNATPSVINNGDDSWHNCIIFSSPGFMSHCEI